MWCVYMDRLFAHRISGMARDVVVLLDYIGWKEIRGIHVVGISLGMFLAELPGVWCSRTGC